MAPPGRRRRFLLSPVLLLPFVLFLLITPTSAISAVLGIDLGTEYIKAALVKPGIPGEIVPTKDSKRKESAALAFKPAQSKNSEFPERLYGGDALALAARFPGDVYSNLKALLGVGYEDGMVGTYRERYPGLSVVDGGRGTVGFKSGTFAEKEAAFLVEELLAMELKNIRANAESLAGKGSTVRDVVITFPAFYTAEEKRAVQLAAELAGLRVLSLMSDGLAVGVNYATTRTFPVVNEGGRPEYHLVFDMGAGSTTATVLRFQGRTVKDVGRFNKTIQEVHVMGTAWDRTLGGDVLNQLIVDDMVAKFVEGKKVKAMDVTSDQVKAHPRTMAKLWKEAERVRQVLSANTETGATFESLFHDDLNFKYKITRAEFEALADDHTARVQEPLVQALDVAKLGFSDLESIILHGGAVRTPFVQKKLESVVDGSKKIRSNVNADEAAAFGSSFKGAALSGGYKVKEIRTGDTPGYGVGLKWNSDGKDRQQKVFTPTSSVGSEKQVPLKTVEDVELILAQQFSSSESSEAEIVKVVTKNLTASAKKLKDQHGCAPANVTTIFSMRLNPFDGLPEITRATVSCEVEGPEKKGGVVDDVKGFFGFGPKKSSSEQDVGDTEEQVSTSTTTSEPSTSSGASASSSSSTPTKEKESPSKGKEAGPRTVTIPIAMTSSPLGTPPLSATELKRIRDRLAAFDASDKARSLKEEALNTLEAFTYRVRDLMTDDSFIEYSTAKSRESLEEKLSAASDWIYTDGVHATYETANQKLKELQGLVDPVLKRKDEAIKRPDQIKALRDSLGQTKSLIDAVREQIQKEESSSLETTSSASSSSTSTETTSTVPSSSSAAEAETDPFESLDSDPYSTSSSIEPSHTPAPYISPYTAADLTSLQESYDSALSWLESKLAEQEKLGPTDDPAILAKDLEAKAQAQSKLVMDLIMKKVQKPIVPSKGPKGGKPKTKSEKGKKEKENGKDQENHDDAKGPLDDEGFEGVKIEEVDDSGDSGKGKIRDEL